MFEKFMLKLKIFFLFQKSELKIEYIEYLKFRI